MARLVAAKCPICGAGLTLPPAAEWVTCRHCQTSSFIQRPQPKWSPSPARPVPPDAPVIHLSEHKGLGWLAALVLLSLLICAAAVGWLVLGARKKIASGPSGPSAPAAVADAAVIGKPVLADANGDGVEDAIVACMHGDEHDVQLRALDARTGTVLWETGKLGKYDTSTFAIAADAVLELRSSTFLGFDARTGKQRFERSLPERVQVVCEADGRWFLLTADKKFHEIDATTGALTPAPSERAERPGNLSSRCLPAWYSDYSAKGRFVRDASSSELEVESMRIARVATYGDGYGKGDAVALVLGERSVGSRIPMLAAVRGKKTVWKLELPAERALDTTEDDPTGFTIAAGTVYATYERKDEKGFRLAAVRLADGSRLWETPVVRDDSPGSAYLSASDRHVFLTTENELYAFSAGDGRILWSHGVE